MGGSAETKVRLQAAAVALVVCADGVVAWRLGAPAGIGGLYVALGFALAWLRLRLARHRPRQAAHKSPEPASVARPQPKPKPVPVSHPRPKPKPMPVPVLEAPQEPHRRAIGYLCIPSTANGELR